MIGTLVAMLVVAQPEQEPEPVESSEPMEEMVEGTTAAPVEDDLVCRRKFTSENRFGGRTSSRKVCKTREQWEQDRRKKR